MSRKSFLTTAALAGSLAVGLVGGSVALNSVASAQEAQPSASASASAAQASSPAAARSGLQARFLDQLASTLGVQRSALDSAISSAAGSTVDAAVQDGTLTQAQGDAIKARVQAGDIGALWGGRGGGSRTGSRVPGVRQAMLDAAAQTLGITADELQTELRNGQTLAQLAQANNTTEQAVIDAALAAAKTQLDQAVAAGTITQAQADAAYAELQAKGSNLLSGGRGGRGGRQGEPSDPQASPSAQATT